MTISKLQKTPTGIEGLDEITFGGLPSGRTSLVCGNAGSGKTVLAVEFLVHGILDYGENGVFMAFEETERDLSANVASFGYDLEALQSSGKLAIDHVYIERSEIEETGEYDLEGLLIRLENAVQTVNAKRVVLDTIEVLFAGLRNESVIRAELRRLFRWLKEKGLTAIVTGERGDTMLTRYGIEEYVADCVIFLDHRIVDQLSTRRLRIIKYRGSIHGTDEYPFFMDRSGFSVMPVTSTGLSHAATDEHVSTGVAGLDEMLGGKGFYHGSSILVSGTAGTGKSSVAAHFLRAACNRGERAVYFGFEESTQQIIRNMRSIGLDLQPCIDGRLVRFLNVRAASLGLEAHLAAIFSEVKDFDPQAVVIDPITVFLNLTNVAGARSMLTRLIDFLKGRKITAVFTHLSTVATGLEATNEGISSIMDAWILLRDIELESQRRYAMYILKSRGMAHSHQLREYRITDNGIQLGGVFNRDSASSTRTAPHGATANSTSGSKGGNHAGKKNQPVRSRSAGK